MTVPADGVVYCVGLSDWLGGKPGPLDFPVHSVVITIVLLIGCVRPSLDKP